MQIPFLNIKNFKKTKEKVKNDSRKNFEKEKKENAPIIEIKDLSITFNIGKSNELHALKNINLSIYPGEFVIMFGPSGCGKSTLLFAISGLESATKGDVIVDGINVSKIGKNSKEMTKYHQDKIGIIFQAFHLIPSLDIIKNVSLPQIFKGASKKERLQKAYKLLEKFNIHHQAKKLPSQLSGGQKQRVAIARSLINNPDILLADEPVGNLDSKSAEVVLDILKELNEKEKRTIILVTHDPRHLNMAHRIFYIKDGYLEKEVVNKDIRPLEKQKEEAKPKISEELELIMRTYSDLSSAQLGSMLIPFKAKQLVQDVLIEMTSTQIKNIEKTVEEFLMNFNTEDYETIRETLDKPAEKGGVGLDSRTAKKLTTKIMNVLEEIKYIKAEERRREEYHISDASKEIKHLRRFILEKYDIEIINEKQLKLLDSVLEMRLKNQIDSFKLQKQLDKSMKKGGVGLDRRNARKITKEMELIMLLKYS